ncbi:inosine/xanthosine triphosphatase [Algoriphagus namhaensis]
MPFPKRENLKTSTSSLLVVGSKNPVKIACAENAFVQAFEKPFTATGVSAASEVSAQPIGSEETLLGARNRIKNSKIQFPEAQYWVGIEGGVAEDEWGMYAFAWICIENNHGVRSQAKTGTFYLPPAVVRLIKSGMELGHADDLVFKDENSKQKGGSVGLLTKGKLSRAEYYSSAILLALIPFLNNDHYTH